MSNLTQRFPIYSKLLRLYPEPYRKRYAEQMLQTTADMLENTPRGKRASFWLRIAAEIPASIVHQQAMYITIGLWRETPNYVKQNTLISALLFVPFFAIVFVNDATGHGLYHSWLWDFGVFLTWIVILPALSLAISGVTLLAWLRGRIKQGDTLIHSLLDVRHNGAMMALAFLGALILGLVFFHDSVHCVTGNPIRELRNAHQTMQCIQKGSF